MKTYKIDDVATKTGLTKRAIRYYEEIGLIETLERTDGGVRLYDEEDIEKLNKIVLAKEELGYSLRELQQFIQLNETVERYRHSVRSSVDEMERKQKLIAILATLRKEIEMIDNRMLKVQSFKNELLTMERRVQEAIGHLE